MDKKSQAAAAATNDVASALLDVLRKIDREAATPQQLSQEADQAVQNFRGISAALSVEASDFSAGGNPAAAARKRT